MWFLLVIQLIAQNGNTNTVVTERFFQEATAQADCNAAQAQLQLQPQTVATCLPVQAVTVTPAPVPTPTPVAAELVAGQAGTIKSTDGTWSFQAATGAGASVLLLNGAQAASSPIAKVAVLNNTVYCLRAADQIWFQWVNGSWKQLAAPPAGVP